jgi:hypothetical protein
MNQHRKKPATFQYSKKHIEKSLYQRRPLSFFEDESSDAEEALDCFDPGPSHSVFDYTGDDDEELLGKYLRTFILKRFLKSLEVR